MVKSMPVSTASPQAAQELGGRSVRTSGLGCTSAGFGSSELKREMMSSGEIFKVFGGMIHVWVFSI